MSKKTKTILAVVLLLVVAAAAVGAYFLWGPPAQKRAAEADAGKTHITFVVIHGDKSTKEFAISTDQTTLREALEQEGLIAGTESDWGLYVLTVDGETADEAQQQWWCLTKDGEMSPTGVDDTVIADGEHYEFELKTGW